MQIVDRFNGLNVTAFVTPGNTRFLMLHDGRNDDAIRAFFTEVYELYIRVRKTRDCTQRVVEWDTVRGGFLLPMADCCGTAGQPGNRLHAASALVNGSSGATSVCRPGQQWRLGHVPVRRACRHASAAFKALLSNGHAHTGCPACIC